MSDVQDRPLESPFSDVVPESVWIWLTDGKAGRVLLRPEAEAWVYGTHDAPTCQYLRSKLPDAYRKSPVNRNEGAPFEIEVKLLEERLRKAPEDIAKGWVLLDRDGEVTRRRVR